MAKNFPYFVRDTNLQVQVAQKTVKRLFKNSNHSQNFESSNMRKS